MAITITQLLTMPIGEKIGGGFVLTVKTTKKSISLPDDKMAIQTVVLFDKTGEMLADFVCPYADEKYGYRDVLSIGVKKGDQVKIIVAQIQVADPTSNKIALKEGKKLYVDQFEKLSQVLSEYEGQLIDYQEDWDKQTRGKIRHGIVCSMIHSSGSFEDLKSIEHYKEQIEKLVEYVFTGE